MHCTGGKAACYSGERSIRDAFKPLGLHREAESDSSCSCVQGTCCTGAFAEADILLQNLPSQLACLSTIMAGSSPRVWTHDLPCRAHHRVEEAVMVACVCVCVCFLLAAGHVSLAALRGTRLSLPLCLAKGPHVVMLVRCPHPLALILQAAVKTHVMFCFSSCPQNIHRKG